MTRFCPSVKVNVKVRVNVIVEPLLTSRSPLVGTRWICPRHPLDLSIDVEGQADFARGRRVCVVFDERTVEGDGHGGGTRWWCGYGDRTSTAVIAFVALGHAVERIHFHYAGEGTGIRIGKVEAEGLAGTGGQAADGGGARDGRGSGFPREDEVVSGLFPIVADGDAGRDVIPGIGRTGREREAGDAQVRR